MMPKTWTTTPVWFLPLSGPLLSKIEQTLCMTLDLHTSLGFHFCSFFFFFLISF